MTDELYERLELRSDASRAEIVHAYRRLAHAAHPDARPGDPDAARRFRELTEAYQVLADPEQRAGYDHQHRQVPGSIGARRRSPCVPTSPLSTLRAPAVIVDVGPVPVRRPYLRASPVHIATGAAPAGGTPTPLTAQLARVLSALWAERWVR